MKGVASHAQTAALKRLSSRANNPTHSPSSLPHSAPILQSLTQRGISIQTGLSDHELARVEAEFGFTFPPDLLALLRHGLPVGPGFPDWRSAGSQQLWLALSLPHATIAHEVGHGRLWPRSWGPRPTHPAQALRVARLALKKAPVLVPIFDRFYIPSKPALAGNPVFFLGKSQLRCCFPDIASFFQKEGFGVGFQEMPLLRRQKSLNAARSDGERGKGSSAVGLSRASLDGGVCRNAGPRAPRWVEFWTDLAEGRRGFSPWEETESLFFERRVVGGYLRSDTVGLDWVLGYLRQLSCVLRDGGWREEDVEEMMFGEIRGLEGGIRGGGDDAGVVLEGLILMAVEWSDCLRKGGWGSKEVSEALDFGLPWSVGGGGGGGIEAQKVVGPELKVRLEKLAVEIALC